MEKESRFLRKGLWEGVISIVIRDAKDERGLQGRGGVYWGNAGASGWESYLRGGVC